MSTQSTPAKPNTPAGNMILIQRFLDRLSVYISADEAETWRSDPRFHYNVKALQDFISEAEKSGNRNGEQADVQAQIRQFMAQAQEYQGALELANVPSYVEPCQEVDDSTSTQPETFGPDAALSEAQSKAFSALRASGPNSRLMNAQALGADVHDKLAAQEDVQEELTDQMAVMAARLRSNAEAQSNALHARDIALDSASQGLLKSVQGVTAVVADTKTAVKRTRRSMFFFLFLMFGVSMVFLGMYGFINVTAMTQAFVPYSTVASTWNTPRTREAPPRARPEAARPVTVHLAPPGDAEEGAPAPVKTSLPEEVPEASAEKEPEGAAGVGEQEDGAQELEVVEDEEEEEEEEEYTDEDASQYQLYIEQPAEAQPDAEQPSTEQLVEAQVEEAPLDAEEPAVEQPGDAQTDIEQPAEAQLATEQPTEAQPDTEQPAEAQPDTEQPTEAQPDMEQPAGAQPNTEQPTEAQPGTEQAAQPHPDTEQPAEAQVGEPQVEADPPAEAQAGVAPQQDTDAPADAQPRAEQPDTEQQAEAQVPVEPPAEPQPDAGQQDPERQDAGQVHLDEAAAAQPEEQAVADAQQAVEDAPGVHSDVAAAGGEQEAGMHAADPGSDAAASEPTASESDEVVGGDSIETGAVPFKGAPGTDPAAAVAGAGAEGAGVGAGGATEGGGSDHDEL